MIGAVKLFLVVAFLLIAAQCDAISVSSPQPRRSPKWDAFMEGLRQKRQTGPCTATYDPYFCPIADVTEFDALGRRESGLLADVQYQGICGSCWAFASAHTYTDFMSIQAGQKKSLISPQYITECASSENGCCGGWGTEAAKHFVNTGAVTEQCLPYSTRLQNYDSNDEEFKEANPLMCPSMCSVSGFTYNPSSLKAPKGTYRCFDQQYVSDSTIMDLLDQGTVVWAAMDVDEMFTSYVCGVHTHQPGVKLCGLHAVEIVDYGTTATGCSFWVVKNSWGTSWGEDGYFRIRRGDLSIQEILLVYPLPVNSQQASEGVITDSTTVGMPTCAAEEVDNPSQDPMLQAAAEVGLEELVKLAVITCPGSSDVVEGLTLNTIVNSTEQIVAGVAITITVCAAVQGCGDDNLVSTIEMGIDMDLDGAFSLTDYEYEFGGTTCGGSNLCSACLLLLLLMAIAAFFLSNAM